jgi:hypothetical protein
VMPPPDPSKLTEAEKDALIPALWARVQALTARVAELEARLNEPTKTPGNSSLPPSKGHKANRPEKARPPGPRRGQWEWRLAERAPPNAASGPAPLLSPLERTA